jgi:endonuclease YncB( thermonuclease family)
MKRITMVLMGFLMVFTVIGCSADSEYPVDPETLHGKTQSEIAEVFEDSEWTVYFQKRSNIEKEKSNQFIEYGMISHSSGYAYVIVSATLSEDAALFEPVNLDYDGPRLDDAYFDRALFEETEEGLIGTAGAFHVDHLGEYYFEGHPIGCIDGDTSVFGYPDLIDALVTNSTPSTRYLNVDTPETFSGGEEEWGQPASKFTCNELSQAQSVVLQTDPGDFLTGDHDRLLAWVWILPENEERYELLNYNIVRQGLGEVAFEFGAGETNETMYEGLTYNEWMHQGEAMAIDEQRAMHSETLKDPYWHYATDSPNWNKWPN